ncbi:hypothetical protein SAMN05892883_1232 [Jatrophihabitans sp. GAS493]|uniref:hypothetical protein n=1 Tax=Jatrophihabitans sp. GAS493 TaxID=1907575 RepID=UPI000BB8CDB5|nr:hypothetical protein [Jatrophihabitans sp. GAS493]SOD71757.1 hypothetical protein SAMN05892883_1232 [Jatrophihabitans sp. GAS493]
MSMHPASVSLFAPASTLPSADCDRHYRQRHTVWARRMLRATGAFESYHTALAISRLSESGFDAPPSRWRYVLLRRHPGRVAAFDAATEEEIAQDHRNFLQDWHGFATEQQTLYDSRRGQSAFEAYLLEIAAPTLSPAGRAVAVQRLRRQLVEAGRDAYGLRAIIEDSVLSESGAVAIDLPGQRPVRTLLPASSTLAFILILFDQHEWAQEWFTGTAMRTALADPQIVATVHRVELQCGFDER